MNQTLTHIVKFSTRKEEFSTKDVIGNISTRNNVNFNLKTGLFNKKKWIFNKVLQCYTTKDFLFC